MHTDSFYSSHHTADDIIFTKKCIPTLFYFLRFFDVLLLHAFISPYICTIYEWKEVLFFLEKYVWLINFHTHTTRRRFGRTFYASLHAPNQQNIYLFFLNCISTRMLCGGMFVIFVYPFNAATAAGSAKKANTSDNMRVRFIHSTYMRLLYIPCTCGVAKKEILYIEFSYAEFFIVNENAGIWKWKVRFNIILLKNYLYSVVLKAYDIKIKIVKAVKL